MLRLLLILFYFIKINNGNVVNRMALPDKANREPPTEPRVFQGIPAQKLSYQPSNFSNKLIEVVLRDQSNLGSENLEPANGSKKGLVEVSVPGVAESVFVCFPQTTDDYRQAYTLSQVICRQMGFMTFASMNSKLATDDKLYYGLKPNSFSCTGQEQNASHCEWNNINTGSCKAITELSCGGCQFASKDFSGFLEVPGYPLVNLYDVTCEWDLVIEEDHEISLSFHHFHSLFVKPSKQFCNLHEPYMEIMYGEWTAMHYKRYCNLHDVKNMNIPHGKVKIRIFTGVYAPYGANIGEVGKGVAITFEAKPTEATSNWPWNITFVALFLLLIFVASACLHYCKRYGICESQRNNILPTLNVAPTIADMDRAYEFQRCAIQGHQHEKKGLRLRSNGSGEEAKNMFYSSFDQNTTYVVSNGQKKSALLKENTQSRNYAETPRSTIPAIVLSGACDDDAMDAVERVKANLLDRYSKNSGDLNGISCNVSISSPVFFPSRSSFQIYRSTSSETEKEEEKKPPPYESAM